MKCLEPSVCSAQIEKCAVVVGLRKGGVCSHVYTHRHFWCQAKGKDAGHFKPTKSFCKDVQQFFTQIKVTNGNLNCSANLVLRARTEDPMCQISFQLNNASRAPCGRNRVRVGRPKQNWPQYAKTHTFEHILRGHYYLESPHEDALIYGAAISRTFQVATRTFGYAHALR